MALGAAQGWGIVGHEAILELLPRIRASTLLFSGPEGVGRRLVARWYALGLNRGFPPPPLPEHPDLWEVAPKEGGLRGRAEVRLEEVEPLMDWFASHPRERVKVAILDAAHLLTEPAANALLKLLEEPPSYGRIVLIAPSRDTLLPTLASRALEVPFGPVPEAALRSLTQDPGLLAYAAGAPGRLKRALAEPERFRERLDKAAALGKAAPLARLSLLKELLAEEEGFFALYAAWRHRPEALLALEAAREALEAYVNPELVLARLALDLET
ncbi:MULTISPECIES: DNA polymerase III subunit delta' [unclassified Thermus]|uniref:DNA polymerase III subunit delta' n=1 Tax=unclassified Thermus TaxID=2619321 RepID=UPI00059C6132|nr:MULTISPECIES: DNA polymerase III subunit delta' [unclassified Thermus]MCS6868007.1 DNA polymerase III subunit delta' [Thermus sp.]MCX7848667.1 DNA polymerase III subunit delta' [Thermus sp.]MDW8016906.1 DNA polymerase III subunit delta' [Thermus sp.]MDW8357099.1 DNA polymerase III subunit delta' [Thermus sp.]